MKVLEHGPYIGVHIRESECDLMGVPPNGPVSA